MASKVQHMISEFRALNSWNTLYIMLASEGTAASSLPSRMHSALQTLRGPDSKPFELMVCVENPSALPVNIDGITYKGYGSAVDHPESPWYGSAAEWDHMLADYGHKMFDA